MKLLPVDKESQKNIGDTEFFSVANNGGTFRRCKSFIFDLVNAFVFGMRKHGPVLSLFTFVEHEPERIVPHKEQYLKWGGKFCPNSCHRHILKLNNDIT